MQPTSPTDKGLREEITVDTRTYGDILGCISQYFYEGWRYRLPQEGDSKIRQESNEAAHRMLDPFIARQVQAAQEQTALDFATRLKNEFLKRALSGDSIPEGYRKLTDEELIVKVWAGLQAAVPTTAEGK